MRAATILGTLMILLFGKSLLAQQKVDTLLMVRLKEVQIKDTRNWGNDTLRYRFNQTRYYVQTILPYLDAATHVFHELDTKIKEQGSKKDVTCDALAA